MTEKRHEMIATGPSNPVRRPYRPPRITDYGSIALMTRAFQVGNRSDAAKGGMMS